MKHYYYLVKKLIIIEFSEKKATRKVFYLQKVIFKIERKISNSLRPY